MEEDTNLYRFTTDSSSDPLYSASLQVFFTFAVSTTCTISTFVKENLGSKANIEKRTVLRLGKKKTNNSNVKKRLETKFKVSVK